MIYIISKSDEIALKPALNLKKNALNMYKNERKKVNLPLIEEHVTYKWTYVTIKCCKTGVMQTSLMQLEDIISIQAIWF